MHILRSFWFVAGDAPRTLVSLRGVASRSFLGMHRVHWQGSSWFRILSISSQWRIQSSLYRYKYRMMHCFMYSYVHFVMNCMIYLYIYHFLCKIGLFECQVSYWWLKINKEYIFCPIFFCSVADTLFLDPSINKTVS